MSNDSSNAQPKTWRPLSAVLFVLSNYILSQLLAGVGLYLALRVFLGWSSGHISLWEDNSSLGQFCYILLAEVLSVWLLRWFINHRQAFFLKVVGLARWPHWRDLGFALIGFACYLVMYIGVVGLASFLTPINLDQKQAVGFDQGLHSASDFILAGVSLLILPPLAEEILMRGFLFGVLRARWKLLWAALLTSVIFGGLHLLTGQDGLLWVGALDTFVLSMVLCWLRERTGMIWSGIVVHMLKNSLAFASLFILHIK